MNIFFLGGGHANTLGAAMFLLICLSAQANILGAAMFEHYCTPHGFEFENFNDPIEDDRRLHTYNVEVTDQKTGVASVWVFWPEASAEFRSILYSFICLEVRFLDAG
jgi:hypothetical protein